MWCEIFLLILIIIVVIMYMNRSREGFAVYPFTNWYYNFGCYRDLYGNVVCPSYKYGWHNRYKKDKRYRR